MSPPQLSAVALWKSLLGSKGKKASKRPSKASNGPKTSTGINPITSRRPPTFIILALLSHTPSPSSWTYLSYNLPPGCITAAALHKALGRLASIRLDTGDPFPQSRRNPGTPAAALLNHPFHSSHLNSPRPSCPLHMFCSTKSCS
ncbi:hypothetical protein CGCF413_v000134 [Colletotrichum fructicola]|nr:hypothetical protein CGCF413_v000134 [Colletotrichum fructicola]